MGAALVPKGGMGEVIKTDVLIVGGGPAGLSVASRLGSDVSAVLVHQDHEIGVPVRTSGGSWASDMESLAIPPELYHLVSQADLYSDNAQTRLDLSANPVAILDVTALYQWLAEQSKAKIMVGTKFLGATKLGVEYISKLRQGKRDITVESTYIVDASGWQSAVLDGLELGSAAPRQGVGIEYEYPIKGEANRAALFFGSSVPTGYGWAFPTGAGTLRLGVGVIQPDSDAGLKKLMEAFLASGQLDRMGFPQPEGHHVNSGILPSVPFERQLVYGRVIRVGDAANMATPVLGEGIRHAIEHGRSLGWAIKADFSARDGKALARWQKQIGRKLALKYRVGFWANTRAAGYGPEDWDRSVARMGQVPPAEMQAFLRNDFTTSMMVKRAVAMAWGKLRR